jgi:hypothetical protein
LAKDSTYHAEQLGQKVADALREVANTATDAADSRSYHGAKGEGFNDFAEADLRAVLDAIDATLDEHFPESAGPDLVSEDAPIPFDCGAFPDHLDQMGAEAPGGQTSQFLSTLTMRIKMMLSDGRLSPVVNPDEAIAFEEWLEAYVGADQAVNGEVAVIDLSLMPSDVLHVVIAVVARIVFEAAQRYRKLNGEALPTVVVLEEAHTFVKRGHDDETGVPSPTTMCRQTFERIAREGRKFGLGLVLASQRPSELSPVVLAQCNTFLLHRIVNDDDQQLVRRLVPDNLGGLMRELPSLPSRHAVLLGWAVAVPMLVQMAELPEAHRPRSADPDFWDVWTGVKDRSVDWGKIALDWTGLSTTAEEPANGE